MASSTVSKSQVSRTVADKKPRTLQLVKEAIKELKERNGSSLLAIKKKMESQGPVNAVILSRELKKGVAKGILVKVKASYKLSDETKKAMASGKKSSKPRLSSAKTKAAAVSKKTTKSPAKAKAVKPAKKVTKKPASAKKPAAKVSSAKSASSKPSAAKPKKEKKVAAPKKAAAAKPVKKAVAKKTTKPAAAKKVAKKVAAPKSK